MNQAGKTVLSFQAIIAGGDNPYKELEIPEIQVNGQPGVVYLKHPSAGYILDFAEERSKADKDDPKNNQAMLEMISMCVVDAQGNAIFASAEEVRKVPLPVFSRLMTAVNELSGSGQKEELGKDSAVVDGVTSPSN